MVIYVWIALGSAIGGVARYWCSGVTARLIGETFPFGTLLVNIVGSFIIGFFATLTGPDGAPVVHEAVDPRVPDDQLDTYLTDARTRWAEATSTTNRD